MAGPPPAGCSPVTECVTGQQWRSAGRHRVEVTVSDDGESGTAGFEESAIVYATTASIIWMKFLKYILKNLYLKTS